MRRFRARRAICLEDPPGFITTWGRKGSSHAWSRRIWTPGRKRAILDFSIASRAPGRGLARIMRYATDLRPIAEGLGSVFLEPSRDPVERFFARGKTARE